MNPVPLLSLRINHELLSSSLAVIHLYRDAGTGQDFLCPRNELMESCRAQAGVIVNLHLECRRLR